MSRQLIEQQRAAYVLDKIRQVKHELDSTEQTEFRSYCNSLPAMVLRNGLGQAMAFVKSKAQGNKGGRAYYQLFNMIEQWLCQGRQAYSDCNSLMTGITERDMQHYRLAQAETLSLLVWVRKFARAEIAAPSTDTGGIS